ncbi:hypothetical protein FB565_008275 [Actinoplanes lutulentus]|uniref:Uncharacterized protein n=1 Tax=Actinoplanes lutulentus TaxID=1287878 RepID=A0A327Z941_9ACTN|nr:hypothetical protein [Actinoplanes lutulentus]MBB2948492.1 hypothetical protein [Actinoplanes lutulentus]RAK34476.1 hypothetical protein B0I29_11175 [Actinoplanes lutulentus]
MAAAGPVARGGGGGSGRLGRSGALGYAYPGMVGKPRGVSRVAELEHRGGTRPGRDVIPAPMVHRGTVTGTAQPAPVREHAGRPGTPARPPIDMDALSRDLWRRFDRQMRIEQQRRGRG